MEFLRNRGAANHAAPFQNAHTQAGHAEIGRAGQPIVTSSDYDGIEIGHRDRTWYSRARQIEPCVVDLPDRKDQSELDRSFSGIASP
jgi:hypothetical protein